jgi:hypothetical protein
MKKYLAILTALVIAAILAAGCSGTESTAPLAASPAETATSSPVVAVTSTPSPETFQVNGTVEGLGGEVQSQDVANGIETIKITDRCAYHEDLEGELATDYTLKVDFADMGFTQEGEAVFTGTVGGKEGTFTAKVNSFGQATGPFVGAAIRTYTIVSGTGALSDLRGVIIGQDEFDQDKLAGTYSGKLRFGAAPDTVPAVFRISGDIERTENVIDSQENVDNKVVVKGHNSFDYHGTLEGELAINPFTLEIGATDGKMSTEGEGTFTGMVNGKSSTFTFRDNSTGQFTSMEAGAMHGEYTITGGTGDLSDLHGVIILDTSFDADAQTGSYTGALGFGIEPIRLPSPAPLPPPPPPTTAPPPVAETGNTIVRTDLVENTEPVTENGIWKANRTITWEVHGELEGTWVHTGSEQVNLTTGDLTSVFESTFTGTVDGKRGAFTASETVTGNYSNMVNGVRDFTCNIGGGTGELVGLGGTITVVATRDSAGENGIYETELSFGGELAAPSPGNTIERIDQVDNSPPVTENGIWTGDRTSTWEVHGELEGTLVTTGVMTISLTTGEMKSAPQATFSGLVNGKEGTFTAEGTGTGRMSSRTNGSSTTHYTITGGTGDLAGISGTITFEYIIKQNGMTGTYTEDIYLGE